MSDEPERKPNRRRKVMLIAAIILALYPLSIGPLAFLQGAGMLSDKSLDSTRPIYAPLRMMPPAVWLLGYYEKQCHALGRRVHQWGRE